MMVKFKQSYKRRMENKSLRELIQQHERMDNKGTGNQNTKQLKSKLTMEIKRRKKKIAELAIEENGKRLSKKERGLRMTMEMDANSNKRILQGVLCGNGASAMHSEVEGAFFKAGLKVGYNLTASGGSTGYVWIRFKDDQGNIKTVAELANPDNYEEGADYPFPTAGMYDLVNGNGIFAPMPLYTEYLKKVVYEGMATTVERKHLLYMRCNFLWTIVGRSKEEAKNGVLHVDFDVKNEYRWEDSGYPLSTILCIKGETQLRFSSVSKNGNSAVSKRAPKKETVVALKPGDGVLFGWKQYHARHIPKENPNVEGSNMLGENERLQAMLSSTPLDFPEEVEDVVYLHGNHNNITLYEESKEKLEQWNKH
jgi:hypothetical protein